MTDPRNDARLHRLLNAYTAEADALMECSTDAEGRFHDPEDEAEYRRMVQIIDDAREALRLPTAGGVGMNKESRKARKVNRSK